MIIGKVKSESDSSKEYAIFQDELLDGSFIYTCSCPQFIYRGKTCKHLTQWLTENRKQNPVPKGKESYMLFDKIFKRTQNTVHRIHSKWLRDHGLLPGGTEQKFWDKANK